MSLPVAAEAEKCRNPHFKVDEQPEEERETQVIRPFTNLWPVAYIIKFLYDHKVRFSL
jgi:hypothetical protein